MQDQKPIEFDELMSRIRAWHYSFVRDIAKEAIAGILDGSIADREELDSWIDETCDGSERVIYNAKASFLLAASDCEDAYDHESGESGASVNVRAFYALRADIKEQLRAEASYRLPDDAALPEGFDLDDDSTWKATPAEESA